MQMKVGVVGVGVMGCPMAVNLLRRGFDVTVYDSKREAVAAVVEHGAKAARGLGDLARGVEAVILMLPGPDVVRAVGTELLEHEGAIELLIDMSTSDPEVDGALSALAATRGVAYLDAPVSRAVQAAWDGELLVMVGAAPDDFERARPLFEALGSDVHHCGPVGSGHKLKLLNNLKIMAEVDLIAEVLRLARRDGLDLDVVERILSTSSAQSFMWEYQARRMITGDFAPGFSVRMGLKDLTLGLRWAERQGLRLPLAETSRANFARGIELGLGDLDTSALVSEEMDEL